jgi:hypothetical protein
MGKKPTTSSQIREYDLSQLIDYFTHSIHSAEKNIRQTVYLLRLITLIPFYSPLNVIRPLRIPILAL